MFKLKTHWGFMLIPLLIMTVIGCSQEAKPQKAILVKAASVEDNQTAEDYYPNGQLKSKIPLVNGKAEGIGLFYHNNGAVYGEIPMKNGLTEGSFNLYKEDGRLDQTNTFKNGLKDGVFRWYYENGNLKEEQYYSADQLNGPSKTFHENGYLKEIKYYANGLLQGSSKSYDNVGVLKAETMYQNGAPVKQTAQQPSPVKEIPSANNWDNTSSFGSNNFAPADQQKPVTQNVCRLDKLDGTTILTRIINNETDCLIDVGEVHGNNWAKNGVSCQCVYNDRVIREYKGRPVRNSSGGFITRQSPHSRFSTRNGRSN